MKLPTITALLRFPSPAVTPQALAWDQKYRVLWMDSRDLRRIYAIDSDKWRVLKEREAPGIPWAAAATNGSLHFTIGEGPDDDRYVYRYEAGNGFTKLFACPEFTGSYLSYDGRNLYLSQWYKHRILKFNTAGNVIGQINVGAEICGHTFVDGLIYLLRGTEKPSEDWGIARLDPRHEIPEVQDIATMPFACRSLTFDGVSFWTNHRAANEIVAFSLPN
jgi:hypothetical protein